MANATHRKFARKFWFCKLASTCIDLRVRLARALCIELMTSFALAFNPYKQPIFTPSDFEDYSQIIIERSVGAKGSC